MTKLLSSPAVFSHVRFKFLSASICALAAVAFLSGCGAVDSVGDQIGRDTFKPTSPTSEGVLVHLYLDKSGSAEPIRRDIGQHVQELLDLYPEALEVTIHYYGTKVEKQTTLVGSKMNLSGPMENYRKVGENEDDSDGTLLAPAFDDLKHQAIRNPSKVIVGVFGTDGGFEDDHSVLRKKVEEVRQMDNVRILVFAGLDSMNTNKLTVLDSVVRDQFLKDDGLGTPKQYFDITLDTGKSQLEQARQAIQDEIEAQKL